MWGAAPPQSRAVESPQLGPLPRTHAPLVEGSLPPLPGQRQDTGAQLLGGAQVGGRAEVGSEHLLLQRQPALQPRPSPSQQPLLPFGVAEGWQGSEGRSWATADAFLQANLPSMSSGSSASSSVKGGLMRQWRWAVTYTWFWAQRPAHDEIRWIIVITTIITTHRLPSRKLEGSEQKRTLCGPRVHPEAFLQSWREQGQAALVTDEPRAPPELGVTADTEAKSLCRWRPGPRHKEAVSLHRPA